MPHTTSIDDSDARARLAVLWTEAQMPTLMFIRSLVRNREDADDILQQTAYTVAKRFDDYDTARPFLPWAIGVARLKVLEHYRETKKQPFLLSPEAIQDIASIYGDSGERVSARARALEACIQSLSEKARALVGMRYGRELKPAAIARQLGTTANTVSNALSRVRSVLRRCVNQRLSREA